MLPVNFFVPKILLCGDRAEFLAGIKDRPYKIVGQIEFEGEGFNFLRDGKFSIDDKIFNKDALPPLLMVEIDCIVFMKSQHLLFFNLWKLGCPRYQILTFLEFFHMPRDGFYNFYADLHLITVLQDLRLKTLLDVNAHFAKSYTLTKLDNNFTEIEAICTENFLPIKENIYRCVYKNFADCRLKHYDAVLIYVNAPFDFESQLQATENSADVVITFVKHGSELKNYIKNSQEKFSLIQALPTFSGEWLFCHKRRQPETFRIYVATHKKLPAEFVARLPQEYTLVHAGRALASENFGYIGDNTGENISHLNKNLNELTLLYWMWKNTSETIVGLAHYRRFFADSEENQDFLSYVEPNFRFDKILTRESALEILQDYDIILTRLAFRHATWREELGQGDFEENFDTEELANFAFDVVRKHLERTQPDYLEAFDYLLGVSFFYCKNMFVTRRNIFDEYCKWLFSFFIDATREVLESEIFAKCNSPRIMGLLAERLQTVWVVKNRLRIKELRILELLEL